MSQTDIEIALAALLQVGALIWSVSAISTKLNIYAQRVDEVEAKTDSNAVEIAEIRGKLQGAHRG